MRISSALLFVLLMSFSSFAAPPTKAEIDAAKEKCVDYLYSIRQNDRAWEPPEVADSKVVPSSPAGQKWGVSAMVALALIEAGEDPAKSPKLQKAVDQIVTGRTNGVYALGLRMRLLGNPVFNNKYKKELAADMQALKTTDGMFGYVVGPDSHESVKNMHSTCYAWDGLYQVKDKIPESAWRVLANSLKSRQNHRHLAKAVPGYPAPAEDGGWGYMKDAENPSTKSTVSSTAAAMTMLIYAKQQIKSKADKDAIDAVLKDGFSYLDANVGSLIRQPDNFTDLTLLKLQNLGKLSNRKQFANLDINEIGEDFIVRRLPSNLASLPPYTVASYLMVLSR